MLDTNLVKYNKFHGDDKYQIQNTGYLWEQRQ